MMNDQPIIGDVELQAAWDGREDRRTELDGLRAVALAQARHDAALLGTLPEPGTARMVPCHIPIGCTEAGAFFIACAGDLRIPIEEGQTLTAAIRQAMQRPAAKDPALLSAKAGDIIIIYSETPPSPEQAKEIIDKFPDGVSVVFAPPGIDAQVIARDVTVREAQMYPVAELSPSAAMEYNALKVTLREEILEDLARRWGVPPETFLDDTRLLIRRTAKGSVSMKTGSKAAPSPAARREPKRAKATA